MQVITVEEGRANSFPLELNIIEVCMAMSCGEITASMRTSNAASITDRGIQAKMPLLTMVSILPYLHHGVLVA